MLIPRKAAALAMIDKPEGGYSAGIGFHVEPGAVTVTNGHILLHAEYKPTPDEEFPSPDGKALATTSGTEGVTLDSEAISKALKSLPKVTRHGPPVLGMIAVEATADPVRIHTTDLENVATFKAGYDGSFPDWKVMPTGEPVYRVTFKVSTFEKMLDALKATGVDSFRLSFQARGEGETDADPTCVGVEAKGGEYHELAISGAVMSCRGEAVNP